MNTDSNDWVTPEFRRELRLYSFVNFYLSAIQQGIQTGHAAVQMLRNYDAADENKKQLVYEWADDHKTFIVLNGGANAQIREVCALLTSLDYPWAPFCEDEQSLGGIITCVAVVLPDDVFNMERKTNIHGEIVYSWTREVEGGSLTYMSRPGDKDYDFIHRLKSCGLAK